MSLLSCEKTIKFEKDCEHVEHYALPNNTILIISEKWDYLLWDGLREKTIKEGKFPESVETSGICSIYSYWFSNINYEEIIYFSQSDRCLKRFNLVNPDKPATVWSKELDIKEEFNFFMWVHYNRSSHKVLILHMVTFDKVQLVEVSENGEAVELASVDIKNVNCVGQQGDQFYFGSNVEDNMPIYIADHTGIRKISFEIESDVTLIEFGFLKETVMFVLYNANEVPDSGVFLINLAAYDTSKETKIGEKDDSVTKLTLHGESDPVLLDGQVLIDKIMGAIAVTTTENKLILHKINIDDEGKYTAKKEHWIEMRDSPTNFSLNKDSLVYCDKDETQDVQVAFYRSTNLRCLYLWLLLNSDAKDTFNPGQYKDIVDVLV